MLQGVEEVGRRLQDVYVIACMRPMVMQSVHDAECTRRKVGEMQPHTSQLQSLRLKLPVAGHADRGQHTTGA